MIKKFFDNIPLETINIISIVSGVITILSPIVTILVNILSGYSPDSLIVCTFVVMVSFCAVLFVRMKKYRTLANLRMEITSEHFHKLLHESRNLFFDIMHSHKKNTLTVSELSNCYKDRLIRILDNLCEVMSSFTAQKVSACIKLITYNESEEVIDVRNATLVTFARSSNSITGRETYETHTSKEIPIWDNTDFLEIVSNENEKDYFYQGNLIAYSKKLEEAGSSYKNSNKQWKEYYLGTICVPIRIEFKRLYHQKKDNAHHILGFLCVDSPSSDAFTKKQEHYNVELLYAYADIIYVLLGQFRHYLKKLSTRPNSG